MMKIGIVVNLAKDSDLSLTKNIINWLQNKNCEVLITDSLARMIGIGNGYEADYIYEQADFVVVLGGDGTILGTARNVAFYETPILGINMGHLGFMTDVEVNDTFEALEKIITGNYDVEERMMIEAIVMNGEIKKRTFYSLNEIGISRGTLSRMLTLKISINNEYFDSYYADGILVGTPTGSTAYSLSAGGPIIHPKVNVILITPLCPHSLSSRSLVVSKDEVIDISIDNNYQDAYLTADGQDGYEINKGDKIIIRKARFNAKLIKVSSRSFYDVLRTKLKERFI